MIGSEEVYYNSWVEHSGTVCRTEARSLQNNGNRSATFCLLPKKITTNTRLHICACWPIDGQRETTFQISWYVLWTMHQESKLDTITHAEHFQGSGEHVSWSWFVRCTRGEKSSGVFSTKPEIHKLINFRHLQIPRIIRKSKELISIIASKWQDTVRIHRKDMCHPVPVARSES